MSGAKLTEKIQSELQEIAVKALASWHRELQEKIIETIELIVKALPALDILKRNEAGQVFSEHLGLNETYIYLKKALVRIHTIGGDMVCDNDCPFKNFHLDH